MSRNNENYYFDIFITVKLAQILKNNRKCFRKIMGFNFFAGVVPIYSLHTAPSDDILNMLLVSASYKQYHQTC